VDIISFSASVVLARSHLVTTRTYNRVCINIAACRKEKAITKIPKDLLKGFHDIIAPMRGAWAPPSGCPIRFPRSCCRRGHLHISTTQQTTPLIHHARMYRYIRRNSVRPRLSQTARPQRRRSPTQPQRRRSPARVQSPWLSSPCIRLSKKWKYLGAECPPLLAASWHIYTMGFEWLAGRGDGHSDGF